MATGDKLFLATQSDVQEVGSKVDIVDTTTKDTNSKVASLTSKSDEINTTVTNNNTLIQDVKTNTLSVGAKVDNVSTNVDTVISKLDNVGSSKWYYSGKTGIEKTLIRKEEMYDGTLEGERGVVNDCYVVGYFVPKVSGMHKITFHGGTTNSAKKAILSIGTVQDFYNAANLINQDEMFSTITDTTYRYERFIDKIADSIEAYLKGDNTSSLRRISRGRNIVFKMKSMRFSTEYSVTSSPLAEWTGLFEANVPVLFFAASNETTNVNFSLFDVTVTYNLTEPYEQ